jgi:hypothetical protein
MPGECSEVQAGFQTKMRRPFPAHPNPARQKYPADGTKTLPRAGCFGFI